MKQDDHLFEHQRPKQANPDFCKQTRKTPLSTGSKSKKFITFLTEPLKRKKSLLIVCASHRPLFQISLLTFNRKLQKIRVQ